MASCSGKKSGDYLFDGNNYTVARRVATHGEKNLAVAIILISKPMTYTDTQLKQALAKMLPEKIGFKTEETIRILRWKSKPEGKYLWNEVLDTELLHLCWLVERTLNSSEHCHYFRQIEHDIQMWLFENEDKVEYGDIYSWAIMASWQQRTFALAKVKGIEIV